MTKHRNSTRYEGTPVRMSLPAVPRFAEGTVPAEPPDQDAYKLPATTKLTGVSTRPTSFADAEDHTEELMRQAREAIRRGDRGTFWDLIEQHPPLIADSWVRAECLRLLKGGLSSGRRGRRSGRYKVHPLVVVGLVQHLIGEGRAENPEQAFGVLDELGLIPYESAKDSFYRASGDSRFQAILVKLPGWVMETSDAGSDTERQGRELKSGDEVNFEGRMPDGQSARVTIRGY